MRDYFCKLPPTQRLSLSRFIQIVADRAAGQQKEDSRGLVISVHPTGNKSHSIYDTQ